MAESPQQLPDLSHFSADAANWDEREYNKLSRQKAFKVRFFFFFVLSR